MNNLCYWLIEKYRIKIRYNRTFNFLASLRSFGDWFDSRFVGNPEDRFCHFEAQIKMDSVLKGLSHSVDLPSFVSYFNFVDSCDRGR